MIYRIEVEASSKSKHLQGSPTFSFSTLLTSVNTNTMPAYHSVFLGDEGVQLIGMFFTNTQLSHHPRQHSPHLFTQPSNTDQATFLSSLYVPKPVVQPTLSLNSHPTPTPLKSTQNPNPMTFSTNLSLYSAPTFSFETLKSKAQQTVISSTASCSSATVSLL